MLSLCMHGLFTGFSGFLLPSKDMHVRLIGDSKLSRLSLCGSVIDWQAVQGVPCFSPNDSWDRLQPPHDPKLN